MLQREITMLEFLLLSLYIIYTLTIIVQTLTHFSFSRMQTMCFGTPTYFRTSSFVYLCFLTLTIRWSVSQTINNV